MAAGASKPPDSGNPKGAARKAAPGARESAARASAAAKAKALLRMPRERQLRLWAEIIAQLEDGKTLNQSIAAVEGAPSAAEFLRWQDEVPSGRKQYMESRLVGYNKMADHIIEISDENDAHAKYDGEEVVLELSATAINRNKLRVDTRKWLLARALPKLYGDRTALSPESAEDLVKALTGIAERLPV